LLAGIALKFDPVIVTEVPTGPDAGLKPLTIGCALTKTDTRIEMRKKTGLIKTVVRTLLMEIR